MESALKPLPSTKPEIRAELLQTELGIDRILGKGVPMTKRALRRVQAELDSIMSGYDEVEKIARAQGVEISVEGALKPLRDAREWYRRAGESTTAIDERIAIFKESHPSGKIPWSEAKDLKAFLNRLNKGKLGQLEAQSIEARKDLAHGILDELTAPFPELAEFGEKARRLINLEAAMARRLAVLRNRDLAQLGDIILAAPTNMKSAMLLPGRRVLEHPGIKSRLAMALYPSG